MEVLDNSLFDGLIASATLKPVSEAFDSGKPVEVSVFCLTYNQEKYIRDALESFLMQLVDFNVEIVIHDDASTDSTPTILNEYAHKYPNIVKVFSETENLYSKVGDTIIIEREHIKRTRGRFIASCEGDDYWTDPYKLFLQKSMLEKFEKTNFCAHKVSKIDLLNPNNNCYIPEKPLDSSRLNEYEMAERVNVGYPFQTSSYFMRKSVYERFLDEYPEYAQIMPTSDESVMYYFANYGGCVYIDRVMSCWRQYTENSWNAHLLKSSSNEQNQRRRRLSEGIMKFYEYSGRRFPSCIERANYFMIVTYLSEGKLDLLFKDKSMRKTLKQQGLLRYFKLRIKALLQKN